MPNLYEQMKDKHQEMFNQLPIKFAFGNDQFNAMMQSWGLDENDTSKIYSIGNGGFILREDSEHMHEVLNQISAEEKQAFEQDKDGTGIIRDAFIYGMLNLEYIYNDDIDELCSYIGITREDFKKPNVANGFNLALDQYNKAMKDLTE